MKIARIFDGAAARWAIAEGGDIFSASGDPFSGSLTRGARLENPRILAPVEPSKIIGVARNYRAHAAESNLPVPENPLFFLKAPTTVIGPSETIELPPDIGDVHYEGELGVVIARRVKRVSEDQALSAVLGYCCLNDVTARTLQRSLNHFTQSKGYDTFCPLGPWIATGLDPSDLAISTKKNGLVVQAGRTSDMVCSVAKLISVASQVFTLLPGDVIATGTPAGVGPLAEGDTIEVEIEGVGTLSNRVGPAKL